jgi:hypothetical protein
MQVFKRLTHHKTYNTCTISLIICLQFEVLRYLFHLIFCYLKMCSQMQRPEKTRNVMYLLSNSLKDGHGIFHVQQICKSYHYKNPHDVESSTSLHQECTNPGWQVTVATKFCTVAPNICGSSVWNLLYVICLAPIILRWPLDFWKTKVALIHTAKIVKIPFLQVPHMFLD